MHTLSYGTGKLTFSLPGGYSVEYIGPESAAPGGGGPSEEEIVLQALDTSVGTPAGFTFSEFPASVEDSLCIVIPDQTRKCRLDFILPLVLKRCEAAGIRRESITLLIAYGTHQQCSEEELERLVGPEIIRNYRILHHDSRDAAGLVPAGTTTRGTEVRVNRAVLKVDAVLLIGGVTEHYFAGFGGGPKLLVPGCACYETIRQNHSLSIDPAVPGMHPGCFEGNMDGNPVQEDIREAVELVRRAAAWGGDFTLQVVLDRKGKIGFAAAGELYAAHDAACKEFQRRYARAGAGRRSAAGGYDLVVAGCGGHPKDLSFIQAHKRLRQAARAVREGGVILFAAECRQGIGSETFLSMFEHGGIEEMHRAVAEDYVLNGTTALSVGQVTRRAEVYLYSELPDETVRTMGMTPSGSVDEALQSLRGLLPAEARCLVVDDGYVML